MKEAVWLLLLTNGRLNRRGFWLYVAGMMLFAMLFRAAFESEVENPAVGWLMLFVVIATAYTQFAVIIKRYHDLGMSGWWSLMWLLPFLNIVVLIQCGFIAGNDGANKYGNYRFLVNA